nr:hypothetical protein [Paraburkholderia oxyphila]
MTTTCGPFDAVDYLDCEEAITEFLTASATDPNPDVLLAAIAAVARARDDPRFRSCFLYTNSAKFAVALARSGYATDPAYSARLNAIIRTHKLEQYDNGRPN